jgi:putative mRNA 3-end processing factor
VAYGQAVRVGPVRVSLHPAGHILGSAQVRVEHKGEIWVVSGDYKLEADPTCAAFEPVRCHVFITESTFGLPIYRWPPAEAVLAELRAWWRANQAVGRASLVFTYALGKAQRVLAALDPAMGPIYVHGAVDRLNRAYLAAGVPLPAAQPVAEAARGKVPDWERAIVIAPTSARGTPWLRRFGDFSSALASGWMRIRGTRRRQAVDRGFVLSDHADWPGLQAAIAATGATRVWVTHGYTAVMARWLQEQGLEALALDTHFGEEEETAETAGPASADPESQAS